MTAIVTDQEISEGTQFPWLPCEVSEAESMFSSFEQYEEILINRILLRADASTQWHTFASSYDAPVRRLFEETGSIKPKLFRHRLFACFKSG